MLKYGSNFWARDSKVNTALAREKAKRKRYGPTHDKSAIDYFYSKLNLSHNSLPDWRDEDL